MPSRKRNKGRARKANARAKEASTISSSSRSEQAASINDDDASCRSEREQQQQDQQVLAQLFNTLSLQRNENNENKCNHGRPNLPNVCQRLLQEYECSLLKAFSNKATPMMAFGEAFPEEERYSNSVYRAHADNLKSCFLSVGTDYVLRGQAHDIDMAASFAITVVMLEMREESPIGGPQLKDYLSATKQARDLDGGGGGGGERAVTKFFAKRISCSCLKEKCKQSNSLQKLGECSYCHQQMDCSKLLLCSRCKLCQYCSKMCQTATGPITKAFVTVTHLSQYFPNKMSKRLLVQNHLLLEEVYCSNSKL